MLALLLNATAVGLIVGAFGGARASGPAPLVDPLGPPLADPDALRRNEPTPEETLALEWVNRFRADPAGEARLLLSEPFPCEPFPGFDRDLFLKELDALEPAQPLVFHPSLILAARNHAAYTTANAARSEFGHIEVEGHPGFTGRGPRERALAAGYPLGFGTALECAGSFIHGGLWGDHWANLTDHGPGGPGGMQAGRGHRTAHIRPSFREFGIGIVTHADGRLDSARLFAPGGPAGNERRLIGGVAYMDHDGDGLYDLDEGLGDVRIEVVDGPAITSWSSGAYTLEPGSTRSLRLRAGLHGVELELSVPEGTANAKLDFDLLAPIRARWQRLIAEVERGRPAAKRRALRDLGFWSITLPGFDPELELPPEVAEVRERWLVGKQFILDRLADDEPQGPKLGGLVREYRGSLMGDWYTQAAAVQTLMEQRSKLQASRGNASTRTRQHAQLAEALVELERRVRAPDLAPLLEREAEWVQAWEPR